MYDHALNNILCTDVCSIIRSYLLPPHYFAIKDIIKNRILSPDIDRSKILPHFKSLEEDTVHQLYNYFLIANDSDAADMMMDLTETYEHTVYGSLLQIINYFRYALTYIEFRNIYIHVMEGRDPRNLAQFTHKLHREVFHRVRIIPDEFDGFPGAYDSINHDPFWFQIAQLMDEDEYVVDE
tara:strand:- start:1037 stop:1579 length:543 start_codon:yes stop_codon:yes gene_type:complete